MNLHPPTPRYQHSLTVIAVFISIAFSILAFIEPELLTGKAVAAMEAATTEEVSDLILHHTFVDDKDASGNENTAVWSQAAATGQGIYLYGNTDSHVRVDEMNNFPQDQFTIAFWMQAPGWGRSDQAFLSYSVDDSSPREVVLLYADKGLSFCIGGTCERLTNPQDNIGVRLFNNQWHHVAITWESKNGKVRWYIDGQPGSSNSVVGRERRLRDGGLLILGQKANNCKYPRMCHPERKVAKVAGGFTNSYNGYLADFRVYNTAKNEEDILKLVYPTG